MNIYFELWDLEVWKSIKDLYEVSNKGRIKSSLLKRKKKQIRAFKIDIKGYYRVSIQTKEGKLHNLYVHMLVAEAFIPNPENKLYVIHKDGNRLNNRVDNLEWATLLEYSNHYKKFINLEDSEVCKLIEGCEGFYEISNSGKVISLRTNKVLKPSLVGAGYPRVCLRINGEQKNCYIHRLVAEAFVPKPEGEDLEVNHKDGNKLNFHWSNLEWITHKENVKHAKDNGLMDNVFKCNKDRSNSQEFREASRHWMAESHKQKGHTTYGDKTVLWIHSKYGEILAYASDLILKFPELNLDIRALKKVLSGRYSHHKGWTINGIIKETKFRGKLVNWYHTIHGAFTCSISDLIKRFPELKMSSGNLYAVLNGKRNHCKGWRCKMI
jgi:hypothetical protein